jgi:cell wall-associated NlpC family hydrolase
MIRKQLILFCLIFIFPFFALSQGKKITAIRKSTLSSDTLSRAILVKKAKEYIGVKYRRGQSNKFGFDCSGFVKYVFGAFDFSLPHSSREQFKWCKPIKDEEAQPGDLVFFRIWGKHISHVGIYLGNHLFIHSPSRGKRVSISSLDAAYYKRHLVAFGSVL